MVYELDTYLVSDLKKYFQVIMLVVEGESGENFCNLFVSWPKEALFIPKMTLPNGIDKVSFKNTKVQCLLNRNNSLKPQQNTTTGFTYMAYNVLFPLPKFYLFGLKMFRI